MNAAGQHLGDLGEGYSPVLQPSDIAGPAIPDSASVLPPPSAGRCCCCFCCYGAIAKENESDAIAGRYNNNTRAPKCHLVIPPPKKQTSTSASPAAARLLLLESLATPITAYHFLLSPHPRFAVYRVGLGRVRVLRERLPRRRFRPKTENATKKNIPRLCAGRKTNTAKVRGRISSMDDGTPLCPRVFCFWG